MMQVFFLCESLRLRDLCVSNPTIPTRQTVAEVNTLKRGIDDGIQCCDTKAVYHFPPLPPQKHRCCSRSWQFVL